MPKRIEVKTGEGSQARTVTPSAGKEAGKERERKIA
jgi:hypothetical protein